MTYYKESSVQVNKVVNTPIDPGMLQFILKSNKLQCFISLFFNQK